jgi:CRP-like cAMP-binding protein
MEAFQRIKFTLAYPAGARLFVEGQACRGIYILCKGRVKLSTTSSDGRILIVKIRTIAADDLWMSPCSRQPSVAIHFTWKQDRPAVSKLLPVIENELTPFHPRPHWGKLFAFPPEQLHSSYGSLAAFIKLSRKYDPRRKFQNEFLRSYIFSAV